MTYIKPETTSNQSSSVESLLARGQAAARQQDWLELSQLLRLLPIGDRTAANKSWKLNGEAWQKAFLLASKMLINADFQHKWEITKLFPLLGLKIVAPLGVLLLDETTDPQVRWFICQILGNFPDREVVLILVRLLQQTTDGELMAIAGKTLSAIGDRSIEALVDLMSQGEHRFLAVRSLSYIRTVQTIPPLLEVACDRDPELRTIAIEALGSFHDERIGPLLIDALQDKASSVRQAAATALGFRPELCEELNSIEHLAPLLRDFNLEVCHQAAVSLGRMGRESAIVALYEVLQQETTPLTLKAEIIKALGWSENSLAISYLQQALTTADELVAGEIITILGRTSPQRLKPQATIVLVEFWQHRGAGCSSITKQILATALGELGDRSGRAVLERMASDSDRKVKLHGVAALKKIPPV